MTDTVDHVELARARVAEQFKGIETFDALLSGIVSPLQPLEVAFDGLATERALQTATGIQLDYLGQLLNKPRNGITDDDLYRVVLFAKIAQNQSQGTPEDVMQVFKLLMQASYVIYYEPPGRAAAFQLTAVGAQPIGQISDIKAAVSQSKDGGVAIDLLTATTAKPFAFATNPDPSARGFGDLNDPTAGGTFSSII